MSTATATTGAQRRVPVITKARDTSALSSVIVGKSGVGKTHLGTTFPSVFMLAIEEGLKGCSPEHTPDHFEEADLPQSQGDLLRLIDTFIASNVPPEPGAPKPWRHLVLDSMAGIEKLAYLAAMAHHRVADMEGKEYKAVWATGYEKMQETQRRLDMVRRTGVNVWILAHAAETYEAVADTGVTFKRWDMQSRGSEKHVQEVKLLWRGWADQVLFLDWTASVEKAGKGARAVGKLRGRVLYTRETGTHAAKTRLKLPPVLPATWQDLAAAIRAGVVGPEAKIRAELEALLPRLGDQREELTEAARSAKGPNALASLLSRAQGILAANDDGADEDATPPAAAAEPPAAPPPLPLVPAAPAPPAVAPIEPSPAAAAAPPAVDPPTPDRPASAPAPEALANDDEPAARAIVRDANDRQAVAKAFSALNPLKLHPDVRKELRDELLAKREMLPMPEARR